MKPKKLKSAVDGTHYINPSTRETEEYKEGRKAFPSTCNPYPTGDQRTAWWTGHYDEKVKRKLGHIFERQKLNYP